jgi:Protein of unknown function DUF88.
MLYIDGYNFYYAIRRNPATTPLHLAWCDFGLLARQSFIAKNDSLVGIKYFTAPIGRYGKSGGSAGSEEKRQVIWLSALQSVSDVEVIEGFHTGDTHAPRGRREKETDVNMAIAVILDACRNKFDRAILLTGDRDQGPTVRTVAREFQKNVDLWLAPNQEAGTWRAAEWYAGVKVRTITPTMLKQARLPDDLTVAGEPLQIPAEWRLHR